MNSARLVASSEPPVKLYIMGENVWRDEHEWPLARTKYTKFYLQPGGGLSPTPPSAAKACTTYDLDPKDPVPTIGGNISSGDGIQGVVVWRADAEQPIPEEWASACTATNQLGAPLDPGDPRITRVTTPAAQGTYAYRVELGRRGCFGDRAEVGQGNPPRAGFENRLFQPGDDRYISFQVLMPRSFDIGFPSWRVITQFHQNGNLGTPVLALHVERGRFRLFESDSNRDSGNTVLLWSAPAVRGRWVRFTFHIHFSANPKLGLIELWGDPGGRMARLFGPRRGYTMKLSHRGEPVPDGPRDLRRHEPLDVIYYDGYTVATSRKAAEANAFAPLSGNPYYRRP